MKTEKMRKKGQGSLYNTFMRMTLLPLILLGVIIISYNTYAFTTGMKSQVQQDLSDVAASALVAYDAVYPGEYDIKLENKDLMALKKGNEIISGKYEIMDQIKKSTGVDITFFFYDVRMLTTIVDGEGNRLIGSAAHLLISNRMKAEEKPRFYDNVTVGSNDYFAYYCPIFSSKGEWIGMIATATPASEVQSVVYSAAIKSLLITLLALLVTIYVIVRFSTQIVSVIQKIMGFLKEMNQENFDTDLDLMVLSRDDELGDMGRFTVHVQNSLRKVIERDSLTGLYNRRAGSKKIDIARTKAEKNGKPYTIAMGDIDFFKKVNDTYGHEAGDAVLKEISRILSEGMRERGFVVRWGGEEFLIVFERKNAASAAAILEDILHQIDETIVKHENDEIQVTMSFGVAECDIEGLVSAQINEADEKLYYAKKHGRNQVVLHMTDE